jgi:hypothetical protein
MSSIFGLLNSFIPFADPTRSLWRDVLLSAVLCAVLYVAPQIDFDRLRNAQVPANDINHGQTNEQEHEAEVQAENFAHALPEDRFAEEPHFDDAGVEQQPQLDQDPAEGAAAQAANPHQPRPRDPNREVGAKKAKAIARRNQQRAYNEWLREQGDAQRAEWARDEKEHNDQIAAEQSRRAAVEAKLREKERQAREARKLKEENERQTELEATRSASRMIEERLATQNFIGLKEMVKAVKRDEEWGRQLVRREGLLGTKVKDGQKYNVMLTKSGWIVRITSDVMDEVYAQASTACGKGDGRITWHGLGQLVQATVVSTG